MSEEELKIEDLENVPTGGMKEDDVEKYNGTKVKVGRVWVENGESRYENNIELPDGRTVTVPFAYIETEGFGEDELGNPFMLDARFPLKRNPANGKWGPSTHSKGKAKNFFDLLSINSFPEAVGKEVLLVKTSYESNGQVKYKLAISVA